jgi:hypothetical protein
MTAADRQRRYRERQKAKLEAIEDFESLERFRQKSSGWPRTSSTTTLAASEPTWMNVQMSLWIYAVT